MNNELVQAIRSLMHANDVLIHLGYTLAGVCVFMVTGIIGFIIAWQLRQDKKQESNSLAIAELVKTTQANQHLIEKNIPELYQKWDAIITGCVEPVVKREAKKAVQESKKHGEV